jgi:hypothetical protein
MRKITLFAAAAALLVAVSACNERKALAGKVSGEWATAPVKLDNNMAGQSSVIDNMILIVDPASGEGGQINVSSMVSLARSTGAEVAPSGAYEVSVAATASIAGTWRAIDDDEIDVSLDFSSLNVEVDPSQVALVSNPLTGGEYAQTDSVKPQLAEYYRSEITRQLQAYYGAWNRFDDVKVDKPGTTMSLEISDRDYVFRRQ